MTRIYLDYSATAPLRPEALEAMLPHLRVGRGNASSPHQEGRAARAVLEHARAEVSALIDVEARGVCFCSGATEANNTVLFSAARARPGGRLLLSAVEHPSVLEAVRVLAAQGLARVEMVPVNDAGVVRLEALEGMLDGEVALVSVMTANNETGVLQPIAAIAQLCGRHEVLFHTDASQAVGLERLNAAELGIDYVTFTAHKLGGPQGVGACWVRRGAPFSALVHGGAQERRRRAGTENIAGIAGFGAVCALAQVGMAGEHARLRALRDLLEETLLASTTGGWVNGGGALRAPHILSMGWPGVEGPVLVMALDAAGVAVSGGSACASGEAAASHVLRAMGQSHLQALGAVRFSLGHGTARGHIEEAAAVLHRVGFLAQFQREAERPGVG